jgi:hypothetical protein
MDAVEIRGSFSSRLRSARARRFKRDGHNCEWKSTVTRLKKLRGAADDRFRECELAIIGGDAESNIKAIELKISHIRPEELEMHHRGKSEKVGLLTDSPCRWQSLDDFPFHSFYLL